MATMQRLLQAINRYWQPFITLVVLFVAALSHGYNMFHYPYYENDEGTYLSYAWALLRFGKLDPYTYWYDHAPAGWIIMAIWTTLTGGFFTFGPSVNTGRVLMLLFHVLTSYFLIAISKKLSGKIWPGVIAVLLFSFSPLAVYYQRRVLLDNIMISLTLCSLWLLLQTRCKLRHIYLSAIAFGIAILTKENAVFFFPALCYAVYVASHKLHRRFAIVQWLAITIFVVSLYPLYALLKHELLPSGWLGDTEAHVSLLGTLAQQFSRGSSLPFWDPKSEFMSNFMGWYQGDPYFISAGGIATVFNTLLAIRYKVFRIPVLLSVFFWLFLMRGKLVIVFYIIPLLPILALNIGLLANLIISRISFHNKYAYAVFMFFILALCPLLARDAQYSLYKRDETAMQNQAVEWIKTNLPADSVIVIDDYAFIDLHDQRYPGDKVFANADWYWKINSDPAVRVKKYGDRWQNLTYIAVTDQMIKQMKVGSQDILKQAFDHSFRVASWRDGTSSYIDLPHYTSTNGDWTELYKVEPSLATTTHPSLAANP